MKKIIHIDMDYFYAQVEERDNPSLKTLPVAIGGLMGGRGVLCTSNYIARRYGVKAAMPTVMALKLCPNLILVPPEMKKYKKVSEDIFEIYSKFTNKIQKLSLDEAYLDITDCEQFNNNAVEITQEIRRKIFEKTGLTASAGISFNKLLSKIGSDLNKPNGVSVLRPQGIEEKISSFSISKIWGVGKVTAEKMKSFNIYTFGDLQKFSKLGLINYFGDFGAHLYDFCRGVDHREVVAHEERKSLSVEKTFSIDIVDVDKLYTHLYEVYEEFLRRISQIENRDMKSAFVKIKYSDFISTTVESKILSHRALNYEDFLELFKKRYFEKRSPVRLLGLGVRFYPTQVKGQLELDLF